VRCARNYSAETVLRVDARDRPAVNRATARARSPDTAASSLGAELGLGPATRRNSIAPSTGWRCASPPLPAHGLRRHDDAPTIEALRAEVKTMCRRYPVPGIS
jgi:hypothetical protein